MLKYRYYKQLDNMPVSYERIKQVVQYAEQHGDEAAAKKFDSLSPETINRYKRSYSTMGGDSTVDIYGVMPGNGEHDAEKILDRYIERQKSVEEKINKRYSQVINIRDDKPVCVAFFSDIHLGNSNADYEQFKADVSTVAKTDGLYALGVGDYVDNWIGKLEGVQRHQPMEFDEEMALMQWFFDTLDESLLAVLAGNHENRTPKIAGIDYVKHLLKGKKLLYDSDEILFTLKLGGAEWRVKMRHKWRGYSKYNETHPMESEIKFGDFLFDIGIGGHTHNGTLMRPFFQYNKKVYSVLLGTYLLFDKYSTSLGFSNRRTPASSGCGAMIFYPDGDLQHFDNLGRAADYLKYLRSKKANVA